MITKKIPAQDSYEEIINLIMQKINEGIQSFEVDVRETHIRHLSHFEEFLDLIEREFIEVIFNFESPNLEYLFFPLISDWDLKKQVKYTGKIHPAYLSVRERVSVYYNVENCLPNIYQFETIKRSHFDVIHYFSRKHKVKTLRVHIEALSEDFLCWAKENELKLSVVGAESYTQAKELKRLGVTQVTVNESSKLIK